ALKQYVFGVLDALGIKNGPAHAEIMMTADGPRLVEIGARVMGGSLPTDLMLDAIGHCQVDWTIACYLEPGTFHQLAAQPYTIRKHILDKSLITEKPGRLTAIPGWGAIEKLPSYFSSSLSVRVGDYLPQTIDMFTFPGTVLLTHPDPTVVEADYATIRALEQDGLFTLDTRPVTVPAPVVPALTLTLPKDLRFVTSFTAATRQFAVMNGADNAVALRLEAGVEEALALVTRHAPPSAAPEYLELRLEKRADGFAVQFLLREPGQDPAAQPEFDAARALETGDTSGLELKLLKGLMSEVCFRTDDAGHRTISFMLKA
ncbi:MAG TPA: ATP-binding protein, partial [bacterium]|nr:ATP-binding protein [bacterium]